MRPRFTYNSGTVRARLHELSPKIELAVTAKVAYHAATGEGRMKTHARWTDRTGAARSGLHTSWGRELRAWQIIFAHAVSYGIWLETRRDFHSKYAIIMDSVVAVGDDLMRSLRGLFKEL